MAHPVTKLDTLAALESNAQTIVEFYSKLSDRVVFDGDADHWSPAHHLVHLTTGSESVAKALRSATPRLHSTARSRSYAEVRDAAATSLASTPKDRLREMGRTVLVPENSGVADLVTAFATASAELRNAAENWTEDALDRHALTHPLMGELTVREMLLFFVVHERHHLKLVRVRIESQPASGPRPPIL